MSNTTQKKPSLLGKGAFTKCYDTRDGKVLLVTEDWTKECLAIFGPYHSILQRLERVDANRYHGKKLGRVTAPSKQLSTRDFRFYMALKKLKNDNFLCNAYELFSLESTKDKLSSYKDELQAIIDYVSDLSNYDRNIAFEISPRNIALDDGRLVLLDCFFLPAQLRVVYEKSKKVGYDYV